jgi:hypothetical protein
MPRWKVTMLLADHAQAINGKLYIIGGGWTLIGPQPTPTAIAMKIEVPWNEANRPHTLRLQLCDSGSRSINIQTPVGNSPVQLTANFEVGRPPGVPPGTPLDVTMAFNLGPLPFPPGARLRWVLWINDRTEDHWHVAFSTRQVPPTNQLPAPPQP